MEVMARSKYIRRAPRKARIVADSVRGMRVIDALAQLEFSPKHAAADVAKAIRSAAANAEHNHSLTPVSRGMAHQYFHRTCHITAVVEDRPEARPERSGNRPARRRAVANNPAREPVASGEVAEGES
jgi:large subunit ribosomal protein L22